MAIDEQQLFQKLDRNFEMLAQSIRGLVGESSRLASAQNTQTRALSSASEEIAEYERQLASASGLNSKQQQAIRDTIELRRKEIKASEAYHEAQQRSIEIQRDSTRSEQEKTNAQDEAKAALGKWREAQSDANKASRKTTDSLKGLTKGFDFSNAAVVWFGQTVRAQAAQLAAQYKASGGVIEGANTVFGAFIDQQNTALKYGVSGSELAKVSAANRQFMNSLGGTNAALNTLSPTIDRLRANFGNNEEALAVATEQAAEFARKGIRPTQAAMESYVDDVVMMQRRTGMGAKEAAAFFNDIANDTDSIDALRSARAGEREAILKSQRAMVDQAIASGMSAEQAREAAKMLNKMAAAKPLDRLKQAAKIRALGGAMGIAGADEAAQAVIAGKRATPEQKANLAKFSENAANTMDQAAGQGIGSEIFATELLGKLDLEQYYGKGSAFSTTLGETLVPAMGDLKAAYQEASKTSTGEVVGWLTKITGQIGSIATGEHWSGVLAAAVAAAVALAVGGGKIAGLAGGLGKLGGAALNVIKGGAGAATAATATTRVAGAVGGAATGAAEVAAATTAATRATQAATAATTAATTAANTASVASTAATAATTAATTTANTASVANTAATAANTGGRVAGVAGKLATAGKVAGVAGAAVDVGMGVYDLAQGKKQETLSGMDLLSPMRWGMYAGDKINKGVEYMSGGQSIGSMAYDLFNPDPNAPKPVAPKPVSKPANAPSSANTPDIASMTAATKDASVKTADGVTQQIKKMDTSNDMLKMLTQLTQKQVELAEKQLVALTLTEKERANSANRSTLRKDNSFGAKYNYV